jgi:hypothetical protein
VHLLASGFWILDSFVIANHGLNHPWLDRLPPDAARCDIVDGRAGRQTAALTRPSAPAKVGSV